MHAPNRVLLAGLALVIPLGAMTAAGRGQDPSATAAASQGDVEAELDEILAEYDDAYQEFMKLYRAAGTDEERSAAYEDSYPASDAYAERLWPIIEANPSDPATAPALGWLFKNHYAERDRATAMLLEHHVESEELLAVCSAYTGPTPEAAETLALIIEKSPHASVKGYATLCLGEHLMAAAEKAGEAQAADDAARTVMAERYGEDALVMWMDADPEEVGERAEETLERVITEYGEVEGPYGGTIGASADGILFELRNLQIGMIAPDVEGADLDGVSFKLSDYRGKVVVLDFWGHW